MKIIEAHHGMNLKDALALAGQLGFRIRHGKGGELQVFPPGGSSRFGINARARSAPRHLTLALCRAQEAASA